MTPPRCVAGIIASTVLGALLSSAPQAAAAVVAPGAPTAVPGGAARVALLLELKARSTTDVQRAARGRMASPAAREAARVQSQRIRALQSSVIRTVEEGRLPSTRRDSAAVADFDATVLYATQAILPGVAVRARASDIPALRRIPGVASVSVLPVDEPLNSSAVQLVGGTSAWKLYGATGKGVSVGIIDSGIDYTHLDFAGAGTRDAYDQAKANLNAPAWGTRVVGGYDLAGDDYDGYNDPQPDANPLDCRASGHGTHVAGSVAGGGVLRVRGLLGEVTGAVAYSGPYSNGMPTDFEVAPGVAPEADLYAIRVFGCEGSTSLTAAAIEWAVDPNGDGDSSDHLDIINLSLGTSGGDPDDVDSRALDEASLAGVTAVVSAGNSGDITGISGSPGSSTRAITVAASMDGYERADAASIATDGEPTLVPVSFSQLYDWDNSLAVTAPAARVGDWSQPASDDNNTDGCSAFGPDDAAALAGRIAVISWTSSPQRCGSASRVTNAAAAGAVGVVMVVTDAAFISIYGGASIPAVVTVTAAGQAPFTAAADAGLTVTLSATMRMALDIDEPQLVGKVTDFTSRGFVYPRSVKPDLSAPGETILSARAGGGWTGASYSGTSMAAPITAGAAALVRQRRPGFSPEQVKARLMNTVGSGARTEGAGGGVPVAADRAGSGVVDVRRALAASALLRATDSEGAVGVSFGVIDAAADLTATRSVTLTDTRASGSGRLPYDLAVDVVQALPGAALSVSPTSVRLKGGQSATVVVKLAVDREALAHVIPNGMAATVEGVQREYLSVLSAQLVAAPRARSDLPTLRLPVVAAPRAASTTDAPDSVAMSGAGPTVTGTIALTGTGVDIASGTAGASQRSFLTALGVVGTSNRLPDCGESTDEPCIDTGFQRSADLRALGFASDAPLSADPLAQDSTSMAYVGFATWNPWTVIGGSEFVEVCIDADLDKSPDACVSPEQGDDTFDTVIAVPDPGDPGGDWLRLDTAGYFNAANRDSRPFMTDVGVIAIPLAALAHPTAVDSDAVIAPIITGADAQVGIWIDTYPAGEAFDSIGSADDPIVVDLVSPAIRFAVPAAGIDDRASTTIAVSAPAARVAGAKVMLLHHFGESGKRLDIVGLRHATTTTLKVTSWPKLESATLRSVEVTVATGTGTPSGTVSLSLNGATVATGTLASGKATLTISRKLAVGDYRLQASYAGTGSYAASISGVTSRAVSATSPPRRTP